jgi:hypothetical protein
MSLPRRIVDGGAGEWAKQTILSARGDGPSEQVRRRAAVRLGITTGAIGATGTTVTATSASTAGAATGAAAAGTITASATVLKGVGAGVLAGLLTIGTWDYVTGPAAHRARSATIQPASGGTSVMLAETAPAAAPPAAQTSSRRRTMERSRQRTFQRT